MRVVDLSADYRLRDPNVYAQWYGDHHDIANLAQAVYGLPEVYGDSIAGAKLVANPGCYPQTAILGLAPLVAGRTDRADGHHRRQQERRVRRRAHAEADDPLPRVQRERLGLRRRHAPAHAGDRAGAERHRRRAGGGDLHAAPDADGPRHLQHDLRHADPAGHRGGAARAVPRLLRGQAVRARADEPARDEGHRHTNFLDVCVEGGPGQGAGARREDNLVRGASGVAVQNFNRMFGFDERTGLCCEIVHCDA